MSEPSAPALSPWALTSVERAQLVLRPAGSQEGDFVPKIVAAINLATETLEQLAGRPLRARTYRNSVTVAGCTTVKDSATVTGAGFLTKAKAHDQMLGLKVPEGARVQSIESDVSLTMDRNAVGTVGVADITFGSAPMVFSRAWTVPSDLQRTLFLPTYPGVTLYAAAWVDLVGTRTALDISSYRLSDLGELTLLSDVFPAGTRNIEIECLAGYRPRTRTDAGTPGWDRLEGWALRLVTVFFDDNQKLLARIVSGTTGGQSFSIPTMKVPEDVREGMAQYAGVA